MSGEQRTVTAAEIVEDLADFQLDADDLVVGAMVLIKVIDSKDRVGIRLRHSPSLDWVQRVGLLSVAHAVEEGSVVEFLLDDDDTE